MICKIEFDFCFARIVGNPLIIKHLKRLIRMRPGQVSQHRKSPLAGDYGYRRGGRCGKINCSCKFFSDK
jgi:hypothetical protein